jgi:hypothetical protein
MCGVVTRVMVRHGVALVPVIPVVPGASCWLRRACDLDGHRQE